MDETIINYEKFYNKDKVSITLSKRILKKLRETQKEKGIDSLSFLINDILWRWVEENQN